MQVDDAVFDAANLSATLLDHIVCSVNNCIYLSNVTRSAISGNFVEPEPFIAPKDVSRIIQSQNQFHVCFVIFIERLTGAAWKTLEEDKPATQFLEKRSLWERTGNLISI